MKKRLLSLALILAIVASFTVTAFATGFNADGTLQLDISSSVLSLNVGESAQLTASLMGCDADVTWSSADNNVATVTKNGTVTAMGYGRAAVTAKTIDGSYGTCNVQVAYRGIDIAKHQGNIDWNAVKASGINFAMIKATEGVDYIDPYFTSNAEGAAAAGLNIGVYHFLRAGDVQKQASQFIAAIKPYKWNYPVACDVEHADLQSYGKAAITDMVIQFCEAVKAAGYYPMIYANPYWCSTYLDMTRLSSYDLWLAHYNVGSPSTKNPFTIWQYSSTGSVPGISGNVDLDYSYVNYPSTIQAAPATPTAPTTLQCDTGSPYSFGSNSTYCYKITTTAAEAPKAVSSNPSAVTVAFSSKTTGGYLYKITNVNAGSAIITTTAANGASASFVANGRAPAINTLQCDTSSPYSFGSNSTYCYKITTTDSVAPKAASSNPSAVTVAFSSKTTGGYLYKITNVNAGSAIITTTAANGASASFVANGKANGLVSDTPAAITMQKGKTYQFKFTPVGTTGVPTFTTANGSVISTVQVTKSGDSYLYKIKANGAGCTGVYSTLPSQSAVRQCIVTVA